jgi:hypothetical protein
MSIIQARDDAVKLGYMVVTLPTRSSLVVTTKIILIIQSVCAATVDSGSILLERLHTTRQHHARYYSPNVNVFLSHSSVVHK